MTLDVAHIALRLVHDQIEALQNQASGLVEAKGRPCLPIGPDKIPSSQPIDDTQRSRGDGRNTQDNDSNGGSPSLESTQFELLSHNESGGRPRGWPRYPPTQNQFLQVDQQNRA